jgi:hypothetical protein
MQLQKFFSTGDLVFHKSATVAYILINFVLFHAAD